MKKRVLTACLFNAGFGGAYIIASRITVCNIWTSKSLRTPALNIHTALVLKQRIMKIAMTE